MKSLLIALFTLGSMGVANAQQASGPSTGTGYPTGAAPITASATGTTAAVVMTLPGAVGRTTYICGFTITSTATAAINGTATVAGVVTGTMSYVQGVGLAPAVVILQEDLTPCIPASAVNTAIVITSAAAGTGGITAVNAQGYQF